MSCDVPINDSSPCLESGGTPASLASNTPSALPQSRCQHCQAFVDNDGQCHNPDCTAGREHLESLAQQPDGDVFAQADVIAQLPMASVDVLRNLARDGRPAIRNQATKRLQILGLDNPPGLFASKGDPDSFESTRETLLNIAEQLGPIYGGMVYPKARRQEAHQLLDAIQSLQEDNPEEAIELAQEVEDKHISVIARRQAITGGPEETSPGDAIRSQLGHCAIRIRSRAENRRPTVDSIDWPEAEPLAWGGYAMVFRVAPGYVAKVGNVEPSEAEAQRWGHEQGYALPVSDYQRQVRVPYEVTEQICAVHGPRGAIIAHPDCTCGHPQDILLMPEAEYIPPEERIDEIHEFQQKVADEAFDSQIACLDVRPSNVMRWRGNLVIVDWGEVGG